jgi:ABC-type amino acid transport substrate-binding protein
MKRSFPVKVSAFLFLVLCLLAISGLLVADSFGTLTYDPVGTLVPPTLVPAVESDDSDTLPTESAVARIQNEGRVRIGILFNEPPFGELNIRGQISGFDADLARKMAELWGVEIDLIQVTRQTAQDMLLNNQVDLLVAAQVHQRDRDGRVEFSQTYYPGQQVVMVRNGDGATVLGHMQDRIIGVVMGARGEQVTAEWLERSGMNVTVQRYLSLDQALVALLATEVDGVVSNRRQLSRAMPDRELARFVDEPVSAEPLAVVMRRQDVNMRNLVNKTLQFMVEDGQMNEIHQAHFSGVNYPANNFTIWDGLSDEAPQPAEFPSDMPAPSEHILSRLQSDGVLRVTGIGAEPNDDDRESQRRLYAYNRALADSLAARWGVRAEFVESENPLDAVANGQADLALNVSPNWEWANRVDFTTHYLLHGQRLMVPIESDIRRFTDLRSEWVAIFADEEGAEDLVTDLADQARARIDIYTITDEEATTFGLMEQHNYDAVFGDSLKLIPHVQANPEDLMLTMDTEENPRWYSRSYIALAVPRNDLDFRLLVEYTLQEFSREGVLRALTQDVMLPEEIPQISIWPGSSAYMGFELGR